MNIDKIDQKLIYEKYFDPNFNWNDRNFYKNNVDLFTDEFERIFQNKINLTLLFYYKYRLK